MITFVEDDTPISWVVSCEEGARMSREGEYIPQRTGPTIFSAKYVVHFRPGTKFHYDNYCVVVPA